MARDMRKPLLAPDLGSARQQRLVFPPYTDQAVCRRRWVWTACRVLVLETSKAHRNPAGLGGDKRAVCDLLIVGVDHSGRIGQVAPRAGARVYLRELPPLRAPRISLFSFLFAVCFGNCLTICYSKPEPIASGLSGVRRGLPERPSEHPCSSQPFTVSPGPRPERSRAVENRSIFARFSRTDRVPNSASDSFGICPKSVQNRAPCTRPRGLV